MDLKITIKDENGTVLQNIDIYQDGSDSEATDRITEMLERAFPSAQAWIEATPEENGDG